MEKTQAMNNTGDDTLTRNRPLVRRQTALLVIDVQNCVVTPGKTEPENAFFEAAKAEIVANIKQLVAKARETGIEVVYTVMENFTHDGRDRSLDYKLSNFFIAKGSWEARVIDELAPGHDEMVISKTSSSLFNSTNFDYLMRNIGIDTIITTGFLTDQCVDHTVRDGADRGYYMINVADACATKTEERHRAALDAHKGYCRLESTRSALELMAAMPAT
jgi:nicotinamidase-related amidase